MEKKLFLAVGIALLLLTAGCTQALEEGQPGTAAVSLSYTGADGAVIAEKSFEVEKGTNAFDAMRENIEVEFDSYEFGPFIKSIAGIAAPGGYYLALYVNGQYAERGISQYAVNEDISIEWKTEKIEAFPAE